MSTAELIPADPELVAIAREQRLAELNEALAEAQAEFPSIPRGKTVRVSTKEGGSYSFSYATLDQILDATRPALNRHGLALVQLLQQTDGRPELRTELRHKGGGVLGGSWPLLNIPNSPQQLGSLLTYIRRYAVVALLGVAAEEDDDARQAAEPEKPKAKPKAKAEAPKAEPEREPAPKEPASPKQTEEITRLLLRLASLEAELGDVRTHWNNWAAEQAGVESAADLDLKGAARLISLLEREEARLLDEQARQMAERDEPFT